MELECRVMIANRVARSVSIGLGALGLGVTAFYLGQQDPTSRASDSNNRVDKAAVGDSIVPAVVSDRPCRLEAVPDSAEGLDARLKSALDSNFASLASPPREMLSRSDAIKVARGFSSSVVADALQTAAVQVPYSLADVWIGGDHDAAEGLIAPDRCTWVVTVLGPYVPGHAPSAEVARKFSVYTAVLDVRSGQYLGLSAGSEAVDLISGIGLDRG